MDNEGACRCALSLCPGFHGIEDVHERRTFVELRALELSLCAALGRLIFSAQTKGRRERERKRKGKEKGKLEVKLWQKRKKLQTPQPGFEPGTSANATNALPLSQSLTSNYPFPFSFPFLGLLSLPLPFPSLALLPFVCTKKRILHIYPINSSFLLFWLACYVYRWLSHTRRNTRASHFIGLPTDSKLLCRLFAMNTGSPKKN